MIYIPAAIHGPASAEFLLIISCAGTAGKDGIQKERM